MKGFVNLERAKRELQQQGVDALLVTSLQGVYYLTGLPAWFTARNRLVFILEKLSPVAAVLTANGKVNLVGPASIWEHAHATATFDTLYTSATSMHMERARPITPTAQGFLDTLVVALRESRAQRVAIEALMNQTCRSRSAGLSWRTLRWTAARLGSANTSGTKRPELVHTPRESGLVVNRGTSPRSRSSRSEETSRAR